MAILTVFSTKRQIEIQNGVFGVNDLKRINSSFLTYFELLASKRQDSQGNHGNWLSALKHLKKFSKATVKFSDIDKQPSFVCFYFIHLTNSDK